MAALQSSRESLLEVRRWAFYSIGATMCPSDLGVVHGPVRRNGTL